MTTPQSPQHPARYGPRGFVAAVVTIAVVETATWAWFPYWIIELFFFGVATVILGSAGLFMREMPGEQGEVGRGILIGLLATPLTIALTVIPTFVVTQLLHLA
jgi:hypothetical protein